MISFCDAQKSEGGASIRLLYHTPASKHAGRFTAGFIYVNVLIAGPKPLIAVGFLCTVNIRKAHRLYPKLRYDGKLTVEVLTTLFGYQVVMGGRVLRKQ